MHGIQYGPQRGFKVSAKRAKALRDNWLAAFPQIANWFTEARMHGDAKLKSYISEHIGTSMDTADRWMRMMREMTSGHSVDVGEVLRTFPGVDYDGMVCVGPVEFSSLCEHHLLPFTGGAWVAYIPNAKRGRIVGLSKLARLVDAHARRLQVQERMTQSIAKDIMQHLEAEGAGVRIVAIHSCMACRGIKKRSPMKTQALLGCFREAEVRQEFYELCKEG